MRFRGQEVPITVESDVFELNAPKQLHRLSGDTVELSVIRRPGSVQDGNGNPIAGATVDAAGISVLTDSKGSFLLEIPGNRLRSELELEAVAPGYASTRLHIAPNGSVVIQLVRR